MFQFHNLCYEVWYELRFASIHWSTIGWLWENLLVRKLSMVSSWVLRVPSIHCLFKDVQNLLSINTLSIFVRGSLIPSLLLKPESPWPLELSIVLDSLGSEDPLPSFELGTLVDLVPPFESPFFDVDDSFSRGIGRTLIEKPECVRQPELRNS